MSTAAEDVHLRTRPLAAADLHHSLALLRRRIPVVWLPARGESSENWAAWTSRIVHLSCKDQLGCQYIDAECLSLVDMSHAW